MRYAKGPGSAAAGGDAYLFTDFTGADWSCIPNHFWHYNGTSTDKYCTLDKWNTSVGGAVDYMYCLMQDRVADPSGRQAHIDALNSGAMTRRQMTLNAWHSWELQNRYLPTTLSNSDFVYFAYNLLHMRDPDPEGYSFYLDQLNRGLMTRDRMIEIGIDSPEFRTNHPPLVDP